MKGKILFLAVIAALFFTLNAGCAEKGLSIENMNLIETGNKIEITFTVVNNGDVGNCSAYISISNENKTLSNKTIYLGAMEKGKSISVKDTVDLYPEYTKLDLIGKCE